MTSRKSQMVESATLAAHHLFDVAEYATKLSRTDAELFHHLVAQLTYLSKHKISDIQLAVSLLCTRVIDNGTEYYKNIARVMKYIQGTICLPLIL